MPKPRDTKGDAAIVKEAQERLDRAREYQSAAHRHYIADMKFANADDDNGFQWNDSASSARKTAGRPSLTVNKTRVHCLQIINDARQNPVQVRINPVGDDATYEASLIYEGIIRHIEYISNAQQAYANATYCQVMGGIGYWRVLVDYAHDNTFDQEVFIKRVADPTSVFLDPDMQQADGSDAKWGFIEYEMTREEFEASYGTGDDPDDANLNNPALSFNSTGDGWNPRRTDDKHVQVVEYYRVGEKKDKLLQLPDKSIVRASQAPPGMLEAMEAAGFEVLKERDVAEPEVEWLLIADNKIIDRKDWPGMFVPIVRVPCEEIVIGGKLDWVSHVRHLRDPQRLYNWYTSQAAEFVALQTKTPYVAVAESIEPYKEDWENANIENKALLLYKGLDAANNVIPPPQRVQPPVMATAYIEGLKISQAEMMMATGQYQAVMGAPSNETSGVAIQQRQRQGENATYHVIDRLASAIRYTGRIILDLIPRVYDTQRVLMIMGEDGTQTQVHIDPKATQAHQTTLDPNQPPVQPDMNADQDPDTTRQQALRTVFNPRIGRYSVVADVGPSFATKRQEAMNAFSQIMSQNPAAFQVVGDFWARNADFPGADELATRLKRGIPPQYKSGVADPAVEAAQQAVEQTKQHAQQLLEQADAEIAKLRAQLVHAEESAKDKSVELEIKDYEAETKRLSAVGSIDPIALQLIVRQLVQDMLQNDDIRPVLRQHAADESELQATMAPPLPNGAANGQAAPEVPPEGGVGP